MKKFYTTIIILLLICTLIYIIKPKVLKKIYPIQYKEHVEKVAKENNIDELLIYSIIKAESGFNPKVKSPSGAIGLMQIMLPTANEVAKQLDMEELTEEQLFETTTNIQIGTEYFAFLLKEYDNKLNLAIIAYNAGIGNVDKWIKNGTINENGTDIDNIPFKETRTYVKKILQNYKTYKELY